MGGVIALQGDRRGSHAHIETIPVGQGMDLPIHQDSAGAAQVDDTQFPAIQEIRCAEGFATLQRKGLGGGHGPPEDDPVHMAVDQLQLADHEDLLDEEMVAKGLCAIGLHVLRMVCIPRFQLHGTSRSSLEKVFPLRREDIEQSAIDNTDRPVQRGGRHKQRIPRMQGPGFILDGEDEFSREAVAHLLMDMPMLRAFGSRFEEDLHHHEAPASCTNLA